MPAPNRLVLSPMLNEKGMLAGDFTVGSLAEDHFILFGSGGAQEFYRRLFDEHVVGTDAQFRVLGDCVGEAYRLRVRKRLRFWRRSSRG